MSPVGGVAPPFPGFLQRPRSHGMTAGDVLEKELSVGVHHPGPASPRSLSIKTRHSDHRDLEGTWGAQAREAGAAAVPDQEGWQGSDWTEGRGDRPATFFAVPMRQQRAGRWERSAKATP